MISSLSLVDGDHLAGKVNFTLVERNKAGFVSVHFVEDFHFLLFFLAFSEFSVLGRLLEKHLGEAV
jgi:hypothetical protein